jgi:hypothetical protein
MLACGIDERHLPSPRIASTGCAGRTDDGERENEKRDEARHLHLLPAGSATAKVMPRRPRAGALPVATGWSDVGGAGSTGACKAGHSSCGRHPQPCDAGRRHAVCGHTHSARRRAGCRLARVDSARPMWAGTPQQTGAIFAVTVRMDSNARPTAGTGRASRGNAGIGLRCGRTRTSNSR